MKTSVVSTTRSLLQWSALSAAVIPLTAHGVTVAVGINFEGVADTPDGTVAAPVSGTASDPANTTQAGVYDQDNWNNYGGASGSDTGLLDSTGAGNGLALTFSAPGTWGYEAEGTPGPSTDGYDTGSGHTQLGSKYLDAGDELGSATIEVTNIGSLLDLSQPYTVYIYNRRNEGPEGDPAETSVYSVNGTQYTGYSGNINPWGGTDDGTWVEGIAGDEDNPGNYFEITGLTGDTLNIVTDDGTDGGFRSPVNGIQIVGEQIPEPSVITFLMGTGLVGLLRRRRR